MKYRVKIQDVNGTVIYYPQYKYRFIPWWFSPMTSYTGHDSSPVSFYEYKEALNHINWMKKRRNFKIKTTYKNVD